MDVEYLKNALGDVLSKGLSNLVLFQPQDPIEYLGLWLLKYVENAVAKQEQLERRAELEAKIAEYKRKKAEEEARLEQLRKEKLEREERERQEAEEENARRVAAYLEEERLTREAMEAELAQYEAERARILEEREQLMAERDPDEEEEPELPDLPPELDPLEKYKRKLQLRTRDLMQLDKSFLSEIKRYKVPTPAVYKTMKACFYVLGKRPHDIDEWAKIQQLMAPKLLEQIQGFDPTKKSKVRKWKRCTRCLKGLTLEVVQRSSHAAFLVYQWLVSVLELRRAAVHQRNAAAASTGEEGEDAGIEAVEGMEADAEPRGEGEEGEEGEEGRGEEYDEE